MESFLTTVGDLIRENTAGDCSDFVALAGFHKLARRRSGAYDHSTASFGMNPCPASHFSEPLCQASHIGPL